MNTAENVDFLIGNVAELGNDLLGRLARMREEDPVYWSERNGAWVVTGYDAVEEGLKGRIPLSAVRLPGLIVRQIPEEEREARIPYLMHSVRRWVLNTDPPDHARLRKLIMPAFNRQIAEAQRPFARSVITEILDRLGPDEVEIDLVSAVAREIPQRMILRLLGLPEDYRPRMSRWVVMTTQTFGNAHVTPEVLEGCEAVMLEMRDCLMDEIAQRRIKPRDDFISALVAAQADGDRLDDEELLAMCYVTLLGGFNTTANTIALGTAALALHPDAADFIRQGGATDGVLMELMRFIAMSTTVPRIAKEDFEWRGHEVKQGQYVFLMLAGANRDPTVFDKPDTLDVERSEQRNMVFAPGLHFCVGHYFAKVQLAEFFSELLQRYHVTLLDDRLDFGPALAFRGVESLNVRLTPRAR